MKKLLAAMLSLTLLWIPLTGCGSIIPPLETPSESAVEFAPGIRSETEYTNESLGLKFTCTGQMVMATDEEISNMMDIGADVVFDDTEQGKKLLNIAQITTVYDMMAVDVITNANVILAAEKLQLSNITVEQYIDALKTHLDAMVSEYQEVVEIDLAGKTFSNLTYTLSVGGASMTQTMLIEKVGGRMVALTFTYSTPEQYDSMLACFSTL